MIHRLSDCQAKVPDSTNIWQYCIVLPEAKIGENCNICSHCFIENGAVIGNNVTIKNGVQVWDGIVLEDNVFIGSNVTLGNDRFPRSRNKNWVLEKTIIKQGASIGGGSTLRCGITIGENAMIGAGSVVTKDVPAGEMWFGNPARFVKKIEEIDMPFRHTIEIQRFNIDRYGLHVRLVCENDAAFILKLRNDAHNARFIHDTDTNVAVQEEWIRNYKLREAEGKEYYLLFEANGEPQGVYRIYKRHEEWCVTGSWVFKPDAERNAALKAMIITHEIVFEELGHEFVHDVDGIHENNKGVINAMKSIGGKFWGERVEDKGKYMQFDLYKEDFYKNRPTILRFVGIKLEK